MSKQFTMAVHRSKDDNYDLAEQLGIPEDKQSEFAYLGYENILDCTYEDDGSIFLHSVNNVLLKEPIAI